MPRFELPRSRHSMAPSPKRMPFRKPTESGTAFVETDKFRAASFQRIRRPQGLTENARYDSCCHSRQEGRIGLETATSGPAHSYSPITVLFSSCRALRKVPV